MNDCWRECFESRAGRRCTAGRSHRIATRNPAPFPARAVGTLAARVQREANVLAYIDGFWLSFWLAMVALFFVALIRRAPPGPFTPAPFGFAKALMRWCGVSVS